MRSGGHQYHHGVQKNLVEGVAGVVVGAAAVLLLASIFSRGKGAAAPKLVQPEETAPESDAAPAKPASSRRARRAAPAEDVAPDAAQTDTDPS